MKKDTNRGERVDIQITCAVQNMSKNRERTLKKKTAKTATTKKQKCV